MDRSKRAKRRKVPEEIAPVTVKVWDEEEKQILLTALKKYGHTDIDNIATHFPHKTKTAVRTMINKLYSIAQKTGVMDKNQIDAWLELDHFSDEETMIPEALKFISLFENHPPPENAGGCDFKALYNMLHHASLGEQFMDVSPETQEIMFYVLKEVVEEVWPQYEKEVCLYIENLEQDKTRKVYKGKKKPTEED